jgi:orotidine-5'-phosphate decarboxylase
VQTYLGREALDPILERHDKQAFVVVRTSSPGAGEFQDLIVDGAPLYLHVARSVASEWNGYGNCGLVIGASHFDELRNVRKLVSSEIPILIPGVGAHGGDLEASVRAAASEGSEAYIVNVSRSVIYASAEPDFDEIARSEVTRLTSVIKSAHSGLTRPPG